MPILANVVSLLIFTPILLLVLVVLHREYQICNLRQDILRKISRDVGKLRHLQPSKETDAKLLRIDLLHKRYDAMPPDRTMVWSFKKIKSFDIDWS